MARPSWPGRRSGVLIYVQGTAAAIEFELVRVTRERRRRRRSTRAWHGGFNSFALSPDGRRLAVGVGLANGALGIWIKQLDRGPFTRLTFGGQDRRPAWSPDGGQVAFIRDSLSAHQRVSRRVTDGSAPERRLARLDRPGAGGDLVARRALARAPHRQRRRRAPGTSSACGPAATRRRCRWWRAASPSCTRRSRPTGAGSPTPRTSRAANEVYVRPFPASDRRALAGVERRRDSSRAGRPTGGSCTSWTADATGRGAGPRVVHRSRSATHGRCSTRRRFTIDTFHTSYEVLPDGRGFIFLRPRQTGRPAAQAALVQAEHWFADVRAKAGR